ncbi:MAG: hypothetical protein FJ026_14475 [Chloroflexi bacterium]|nr:hypothetical protein [Chloroflexota bacterium]
MSQDVLEMLEAYRSGDMGKTAKLASTLHYRRLQLLLLGEILAELRKLNQKMDDQERQGPVSG